MTDAPGNSMTSDFMQARAGSAARPDDSWMRALVEAPKGGQPAPGGAAPGGAAPATSASPTPQPGPAADVNQSWGARIQNYFTAAGQRAVKTYTGDVAQSWDQLKQDFIKNTGFDGETREAFTKGTFWDQMKAQFDQTIATGKLPFDAFKTAISPILTAPIDVGTGEIAHATFQGLPEVPGYGEKEFHDALNTAVSLIGPAGDAEKMAALTGKEPPGGAPPGGAAAAKGQAEGTANENEPKQYFDLAGSKAGDNLEVTPEARQAFGDWMNGRPGESPIQMSLEGLSPDADINEINKQIAQFLPPDAVKPDDVRDMLAYSLNLPADEIFARLKSDYPSDELTRIAAAHVNAASDAARRYAQEFKANPSDENKELATRAFAYSLQRLKQFREAGTDQGRAMRARQDAIATMSDHTKQTNDLIEQFGPDNLDEGINKLADMPDPKQVAPWLSALNWMRSRDGMLYGYYNALLSNPLTVIKKLSSDFAIGVGNVAQRGVGEAMNYRRNYIAGELGTTPPVGGVAQGETLSLINGYIGGMGDAIRAAGKALKAGQSQFHGDYNSLYDGQVIGRNSALSNSAVERIDGPTRGAIEFLRSAMPTSWIGAADDFAKVANYNAEKHALVFREVSQYADQAKGAAKRARLWGAPDGISPEDYRAYLLNNLPPELHDQAVAASLKNTLSEPLTGLGAKISEAIDAANVGPIPVGRILLPFTKISTNVMRQAYRSSPLGAVPWLRSDYMAGEINAGGARRDLAYAQMGLGTAASMIFAGLAMSGKLTGAGPSSRDQAQARQRAGVPPYSMHIGGQWYGYGNVEPFATTAGMTADSVELMHYANDQDRADIATSMVLGLGHAMVHKSYMSGLANFLDAMEAPDRNGKRFADNLIASFEPQALSAVTTALDPWVRQHKTLMDTIASRTPGWSETLPPSRNVWGEPIERAAGFPQMLGGLSRAMSPIKEQGGEADPIDAWVWNHRAAFDDADTGRIGLNAPGPTFNVGGASVTLTPQQLDRLKVLTGQETKINGLGGKEALNALVGGNHPDQFMQDRFNAANDAARAKMIVQMWNGYRKQAKGQLLIEDGHLQDTLKAAGDAKVQRFTAPNAVTAPTIGGAP